MAYDYQLISKIQRPGVASPDNIRDAYKTGIYTVIGTQTAKTGAWTGALHGVPALYTGLTINYYLPYDGSGNATLELTLDDGTTTGAINCYISTGRLTTHLAAGRSIIMTYYKAGDITIGASPTTDNRWICDAFLDTNTNSIAYDVRNAYNSYIAGPNKVFRNTIIMQCADGRWESIVTSSSTGTTKARNTHGFRLGQIAIMNVNATYAENTVIANNNVYHASTTTLVDHRYSFNTANNATSGTVAQKPIYLVGAINNSDGLFYLDTTWWTQTLPSTEDGKLYIYVGDAYDYYRMTFVIHNPIYHYTNGAIREVMQDAATVNGLTVQTAVPANAKFTDTTYTFANGTNGFTVTPSGGTAQTVTVTPSITNNVTGTGTSGYLAKLNGAHTITNGPQLGSSTTTYLNNAGSWATPPDTKNTAGSTDTSSKIFLIGATSQAANPQTYSDNEVYATSGTLTTNKVQVGGGSCTLEYNTSTASLDFVFS